jgi:hypothetical protein
VHRRVNDALWQAGYASGCSAGAIFIEMHSPITEADMARADRLMYDAKIERRSVIVGPRYVEAGPSADGDAIEQPARLSACARSTRASASQSQRLIPTRADVDSRKGFLSC